MKHRIISSLLASTLLVASVGVSAQGRGNGPDHRGGPPHGHAHGHDKGPKGHAGPRGGPPDRDWNGRHADYRGPAPRHWNRGDRLPYDYRTRQYYVTDWRAHRLPPPQRGQQWVAVGADYFLIGVASRVIAATIFGR